MSEQALQVDKLSLGKSQGRESLGTAVFSCESPQEAYMLQNAMPRYTNPLGGKQSEPSTAMAGSNLRGVLPTNIFVQTIFSIAYVSVRKNELPILLSWILMVLF
jgi:hypothetical protein